MTRQEQLDALLQSARKLALLEHAADQAYSPGEKLVTRHALKRHATLHQELYDDYVRDDRASKEGK